MNLLYGKRFSKDLDAIRNESKVRRRLLDLMQEIKNTDSPTDIKVMIISNQQIKIYL
jgi:hypothetical protein